MKTTDFQYDLPAELIASYPLPERTASRLLCLDGTTGEPASIPSILNAGWQVYLDAKDRKSFFQTVSAHTSEDESLALANFNELLLKAVESNYTVIEWNRLKNEWEKKQKKG